jgi:thiol-disulfide isomerase/thioredoxin
MPASKKGGVLVVSSGGKAKELAKKIHNDEPILLLYHADWCPHCVDYVGHPRLPSYPWQQVCSYIQTEFGGAVCCSEVESEHISLLPTGMPQVRGFPTLMFIQGNRMEEFGGDRKDKEAIKAFLQKNIKTKATQRTRRPATAGGAAKTKAVKATKDTKAKAKK